jgi:hypothetical protein
MLRGRYGTRAACCGFEQHVRSLLFTETYLGVYPVGGSQIRWDRRMIPIP